MLEIMGQRQGRASRTRIREGYTGSHTGALLLLVIGSLLIVAVLSNGVALAETQESLLFKLAWKDASELGSVENAGCVVRYCQPGLAIIETKESELGTLRSMGFLFDIIDSTRAGKRYWLLTPAEPGSKDSLAAYGKLVSLGNDDLYLLGVDEMLEPRLAPFVSSLTLLPERIEWRTFFRRGMLPQVRPQMETRGVLGAGKAQFVRAVASAVNIDSIRADVHFLSFNDESDSLRSRYTFRDSLFSRDWLVEKLGAAIGSRGTASPDSFVFRYGGLNFTRYNVVGRLPGRVPGSGTFVLCAHYDSQGGRTVYPEPGRVWNWRIDPAPGADDNGSGVASVLECARALSALEFDFDIEFVLFCAEEQGLFGSKAYVQSRKAQGYNILGALNFDMHAFRVAPDTTFLRTNPSSDWLSSHMKTISEALFDSVGLRVELVPVDGPYDASDHSSFWFSGFDAVHFFEQAGLPVLNPYYHTINDTAGTLNYQLSWRVARLAAASMAYFSTTSTPWDLEVLPGDLEVRLEGHTASVSEGSVGEVLTIAPSFHNIGASVPDTISLRVSVYDGDLSSGRLIGERLISAATTPIPSGGSPVIEPFSWLLTEGDVGAHSIYLVVDAGNTEQDRANNAVMKTFRVGSQSLAIKRSFVFPNPSDVPLSDITLRVFVTRDAGLAEVDVYDISGRRVGGCRDGKCGSSALLPGDNDVALSDILSGSQIAPGVYIYRLSVNDGVQKKVCYGRFAIVR